MILYFIILTRPASYYLQFIGLSVKKESKILRVGLQLIFIIDSSAFDYFLDDFIKSAKKYWTFLIEKQND